MNKPLVTRRLTSWMSRCTKFVPRCQGRMVPRANNAGASTEQCLANPCNRQFHRCRGGNIKPKLTGNVVHPSGIEWQAPRVNCFNQRMGMLCWRQGETAFCSTPEELKPALREHSSIVADNITGCQLLKMKVGYRDLAISVGQRQESLGF